MAASLVARYRRWYDYERDCNAKVIAALKGVPENAWTTPAFRKATTLLAHLVAARQLWLYRLGARPDPPREFFPEDVPMQQVALRLGEIEAAWTAYLQRLEDADLERVVEYRALDGDPYRNTLEDILTQLFGHAWYHRGQIAALVRSLGAQPPITDFVYWTRQAIDPQQA